MIKVFNANERAFTNNGDKILHPIKAVILKEDNGDYQLDLETRIEDKDYVVKDKIIVCDTPWGQQGFRVNNPVKKNNKITCTCKHLFYDTADYLIADANIVDKTCNDALDDLNNSCDTVTPFVTLSDVQEISSAVVVRKTLEQAISILLEQWGGHLIRDNFNIEIRQKIGQDNGVTLRYGKNIQDIQVKEDWSKVVTKLLPVGKDDLLLPATYVTTSDLSPDEVNYGLQYDKPYTKTVSFSQDISEDDFKVNGELDEEAYKAVLLQDLKDRSIAYIRANCVPSVNYTVKANIERITDVGDVIEVFDERLNINLLTNVISVKYDCIQDRYIEVNFGNFTNKLKNLIATVTNSSKTEIKDTVSNEVVPQVEAKLKESYAEIWSALGDSYCIYDGDKILIVDTLPKEQATNCIMLNSAGISFSKNGINGQFTSAWTIDGILNMQAINVINLVADMIRGGTLKLGNEVAQQGRLELYDEANKLIGEMNTDGITMYANDGTYIKINNKVGFAGYDKNNNKIYWADGDTFCTNKFIANDEITIGGKARILPIKSGTSNGIGIVKIYTGD